MESFRRDETYRIYVTRSLQLIPQNKYVKLSYSDLASNSKGRNEKPALSGDEIVKDIMGRAGLRFR